jgi:hypothetical protein
MIWHTAMGDRVLEGIEANFYVQALQDSVNYLQEIEQFDDASECLTGDNIFDNASFNQKIVLLHSCLSALLKPDVPLSQLTNTTEAAAFFPFAFLRMKVEEEIDLEQEGCFEEDEDHLKYHYRRIVWRTFEKLCLPSWQAEEKDLDEDEEERWFDIDYRSVQIEQWELVVDELADRIFWDRDWQVPSQFPQLLDGIEPEFSQTVGIDENYVTNRLPSVSPEKTTVALLEIQNWK